jgi:outer membrane protein TolC
MKSITLSAVCVLFSIVAAAQDSNTIKLSLKECVQLAVERNINVERVRIDREKSGHRVHETRSALLPRVNVGGSFTDYIEKPKTLLPGIIFGRDGNIPIEMGTQFNTSASVGITQVLYNQSALTGLKIAKQMETFSGLGIEKASEELIAEITKLYFLTMTTVKQKDIVEENIARMKRLRNIIQLLVENGMGRETDYERISVSLENLYTQQSNVNAVREMQLNLIKYMLEIPMDETIVLTDSVEMPLLKQMTGLLSDFSEHVDIRMLESQREINRLTESQIRASYLPSLTFVGQTSWTGYRDAFKNYFGSSPESMWFRSSYIGLSLSIPLFDGFEKRSKSRQARLDYRKTEITLINMKERFNVNYQNALNNYHNHKNNVERQQKNIALATKVYQETALKYREGLATMSEVLQDEIALSSAQTAYLSALYQFREAEVNIMSLNGEIKGLINNI